MNYLISIRALSTGKEISHKMFFEEDLLVIFARAMTALEELSWVNTPISAKIFIVDEEEDDPEDFGEIIEEPVRPMYVGEVRSPMYV